jgi:hypothetical protein
MDTSLIIGFGFILLGAICNGIFALFHKFVKEFAWENTWGCFFFFTMLLIPALFAAVFLNGAFDCWSQVWNDKSGPSALIIPMAFGFLWGCGSLSFGIGVSMIGLSLGYAIIMGLASFLGSLIPLLRSNVVFDSDIWTVIAGILVCVAGVAVSGYAGILREQSQVAGSTGGDEPKRQMAKGLIVCILAGIFSSGFNLAFDHGADIPRLSETKFGNPSWIATLALLLPIFWGGFLAAGSFAVFQLFKNSTWKNFVNEHIAHNLTMTFLMALLHFLTLFFYGIGAYHLGALGTSVGWAVFMAMAVILANLMGFVTAEWKGSSSSSRRWLYAGLAVLVVGIVVLAIGKEIQG